MNILVTGVPGAGKTTVAQRLVHSLLSSGTTVSGFLTAEIRERGQRTGFQIHTTSGEQHLLASVHLAGPPRVGRYGVDVAGFERVALPALRRGADVAVVDELGRMELASRPFCEAVDSLFDGPADLVATVHARAHPVTDRLKRRSDIDLIEVSPNNRDSLPEQLAIRLRRGLNC